MTDVDFCWSRIGIDGDHSCAELARVIHCRNCAVFARAARLALERPAPDDYLEQWAERVVAASSDEPGEVLSSLVFRLGETHLALPTVAFIEAVELPPVHAVPHRRNDVLLGLANVRGELELCVSLSALLAVARDAGATRRPRLVVIEQDGERWAFPVDDILGVHRIAQAALTAPGDADPGGPFVRAAFALGARAVALLDAELVCAGLRRAVA
ncbi:MAG: chemotaxis protein CheW [bacterium]